MTMVVPGTMLIARTIETPALTESYKVIRPATVHLYTSQRVMIDVLVYWLRRFWRGETGPGGESLPLWMDRLIRGVYILCSCSARISGHTCMHPRLAISSWIELVQRNSHIRNLLTHHLYCSWWLCVFLSAPSGNFNLKWNTALAGPSQNKLLLWLSKYRSRRLDSDTFHYLRLWQQLRWGKDSNDLTDLDTEEGKVHEEEHVTCNEVEEEEVM
jgi:hypothetical protein